MKKLIIIPAFNESASIVRTVEEIRAQAPEFDYIVINDCSTDGTGKLCHQRGFHVIDLPLNLGIGGAVQTGYRYARDRGYDMAVQVDGDGQHDPMFLREMARELEHDQADMVIGSRFLEKKGFQSSAIRRVGIRYFTRLIRLATGQTITDPTSGLRMVGKRAIALFAVHYPEDYPEPESVTAVLKKGWKVKEIPVIMRERKGGVSSISAKRSVYYMIKVTLAILIEWIRKEDEDEY